MIQIVERVRLGSTLRYHKPRLPSMFDFCALCGLSHMGQAVSRVFSQVATLGLGFKEGNTEIILAYP